VFSAFLYFPALTYVPGYAINNILCTMTAAMTPPDERIVKKTACAIAESYRALDCAAACRSRTFYSTFRKCGLCLVMAESDYQMRHVMLY